MHIKIRLAAVFFLLSSILVTIASATRLKTEIEFQQVLPESALSNWLGEANADERLNQFADISARNPSQSRYALAFAEHLENQATSTNDEERRDDFYQQSYLAYERVLRVRPTSARALLSLAVLSAYSPDPDRDAGIFFERALKQGYWDSSLSDRILAAGFSGWSAYGYRRQRAFTFWLGKNLEQNRINFTLARTIAERYGRLQEFSVVADQFAG